MVYQPSCALQKILDLNLFWLILRKSRATGPTTGPHRRIKANPSRAYESPEYPQIMDAEDDFEPGDFSDDELVADASAEDVAAAAAADRVPVWRLIEMSRENRHLKMQLADFDDYDDYDDKDDFEAAQGDLAVGLSH